MTPDAVIAGFPRTGSTWLASSLAMNPGISISQPKEPSYYRAVLQPHRARYYSDWLTTRAAYENAWRHAKPAEVKVDASVHYAVTPGVERMIHEDNRDAGVLFITRDPIDRAWSHACFAALSMHGERPPTTVEGLEPYLAYSDYEHWMKPWQELFPYCHVLSYDTIRHNPAQAVREAYEALTGRHMASPPSFIAHRTNRGGHRPALYETVQQAADALRYNPFGRYVIAAARKLGLNDRVARMMGKRPDMPPYLRQGAVERFEAIQEAHRANPHS